MRLQYLAIAGILFCSCGQKNTANTNPGAPVFKDSAVQVLSRKIADDPKNARLYYDRGMLLHRLEADTFALEDFRKAATLDSTKAEYFSAVGDLMFEHKDVSGSVPWIQKAVSLNPKDPQAHMKIAKLFVFIKEYPKAFSEINTALRQNAMNPEGYFLKGIIYKDLNDTSKAISSFQTALQVDPSYKEAMIQLGSIYSKLNNPVALTYYSNAFKLDTLDVFPLYARGMYYQDQEKYEEAKQEYRNAVIHNKNYDKAYFSIGYILMQQDSLEKAYRQFDLVTKLSPTNAGAYYNRGLCNEMMGKKAEALEDYKQALAFDSEYKEAKEAIQRVSK